MQTPKDSRVHAIMETYAKIHGEPKAHQLDCIVFLCMNVVAIKANASVVSQSNAAAGTVLNMNATAMIGALVELAGLIGIDKRDLLMTVEGLTKDIGERCADTNPNQG